MRFFSALVLFAAGVGLSSGSDTPIVGIFTQPLTSDYCESSPCQYIAASYVKFVESFGGRATPIPYAADAATLTSLFSSINGVLMPGGDAGLPASASTIYDLAKTANDNGDHFPIWGTCNGFEWLVELSGGTLDSGFDSENISLPLVMTDDAPDSRLLSDLDPRLYSLLQSNQVGQPKSPCSSYSMLQRNKLSQENSSPLSSTCSVPARARSSPPTPTPLLFQSSAMNNHFQGITPGHFAAQPVASEFTVLSTSFDRQGREFVSTMEAKTYPVRQGMREGVGLVAKSLSPPSSSHTHSSMEFR